MFDTSTTTSAPFKVPASSFPVDVFTPVCGDALTASGRGFSSLATILDPTSPIPRPMKPNLHDCFFSVLFRVRSNVKPCMQFALSSVRHEPEPWFVCLSSSRKEEKVRLLRLPISSVRRDRSRLQTVGQSPTSHNESLLASVEATGPYTGPATGWDSGAHSHGVEPLDDGFIGFVRALRIERPVYCAGFKPWREVCGGDA